MTWIVGQVYRFRCWWAYVLDDSRADPGYGNGWLGRHLYWRVAEHLPWVWRAAGYPARFLCRWRGHPAGVWWYSSSMEPDMRCKGCGEDLG